MLVADGMAEFHRNMDDRFGFLAGQRREVCDQHVVEPDANGHNLMLFGQIFDNIAVEHLRMAFQRHGIFVRMIAADHEAAFLGCPLVEVDVFDFGILRFLHPFGSLKITYDFRIYFHRIII